MTDDFAYSLPKSLRPLYRHVQELEQTLVEDNSPTSAIAYAQVVQTIIAFHAFVAQKAAQH